MMSALYLPMLLLVAIAPPAKAQPPAPRTDARGSFPDSFLQESPIPEAWRWRELRGNVRRVDRLAIPVVPGEVAIQPRIEEREVELYDTLGHLLESESVRGGAGERSTTLIRHTYDRAGRLVGMQVFLLRSIPRIRSIQVDPGWKTDTSMLAPITVSHGFDSRGRLITWTSRSDEEGILERASFTYDRRGRLVSRTRVAGDGWTERIVCARGRGDTMTITTTHAAPRARPSVASVITVAPDGTPARRVLYDGSGSAVLTEYYTDGRVTSTLRMLGRRAARTEYTYDLDGHGNWIRKSRKGGPVLEQRTITYY